MGGEDVQIINKLVKWFTDQWKTWITLGGEGILGASVKLVSMESTREQGVS